MTPYDSTQTAHKLIRKRLDKDQTQQLQEWLIQQEPVELCNYLLLLEAKDQRRVIELIPHDIGSEVLAYLQQHHSPIFEQLVADFPTEYLSHLIQQMPSDDAADVLSDIDEDRAEEVLDSLSDNDREEITQLMQYASDTAGGIMNPYVVSVRQDQTVSEAIENIRQYIESKDLQTFYTVYVVDDFGHLVGFTEVTQFLLATHDTKIKEIMDPHVVAVGVEMDQEEVARIAQEYDLVVVPVIDEHLRLIGRITIDDLMDVLYEEYQEDLAHIAGTGDEEVLETSVFRTTRDRLPWLLLGLLGGVLTAVMMSVYEHYFTLPPTVVYFVPLIAALGGNIGIQSSSIVVRGLATGEIRTSDLLQRLWKELRVGLLNGIVCSTLLIVMAQFITKSWVTGSLVGAALLMVVLVAATVGATVPILLKRINVDPALATGPFITTANDILGIAIYLGVTLNQHAILEMVLNRNV